MKPETAKQELPTIFAPSQHSVVSAHRFGIGPDIKFVS